MILDGTFAYRLSIENVNRSLTRGRKVEIYYIYQEPKIAWIFTKKREELENRKVTLGLFINTFIVARENVIKAKKIFGDKIKLNLVLKNYDTKTEKIYLDVSDIDDMLFRGYSVEDLQMILGYN